MSIYSAEQQCEHYTCGWLQSPLAMEMEVVIDSNKHWCTMKCLFPLLSVSLWWLLKLERRGASETQDLLNIIWFGWWICMHILLFVPYLKMSLLLLLSFCWWLEIMMMNRLFAHTLWCTLELNNNKRLLINICGTQ